MDTQKLKEKRLFLLDLDGTLYLDETLFDGTLPFLNAARQIGARVIYLTNNSSRSVSAYVEKLRRLGISAAEDDFVTSVDVTADYLKKHHPGQLCYVLGTRSLCEQLERSGCRITRSHSDETEVLVMGYDTELTYEKLDEAARLLTRGVAYVATNPDLVCPTDYGYVPDCGSVAQMLKNATGREPVFLGKPAPDMIRLAEKRAAVGDERTVLVGDRVYTDIAAGERAGVDTVMVLSGEGTVEQAKQAGVHPTWILPHVGVLADVLLG